MPDAQSETGAEVFEEAAIVLVFMLGFVEIPVDGDGLVDEIRVGLHDAMGP